MHGRLLPVLLTLAAWAACAGCAARDTPPAALPLLVGAPPSERAAFEAAAAVYRRAQTEVSLVYGAADYLATSGLPLDLVAVETQGAAEAFGPRVAERWQYARDPLCLVVKKGSPAEALESRFSTLAESTAAVVVADSRGVQPTGRVTEATLGRMGLRAKLNTRLIYAGPVSDVIARVEAKPGLLGIVRATDLVGPTGAGVVTLDVVDEAPPSHVASLLASPRQPQARRFLEAILSEEAQTVLRTAGLQSPLTRVPLQ